MISSLPHLADKNFVMGFVVPVMAVLIALAFAFPDTSLHLTPLRAITQSSFVVADLVYLLVTVWCLALGLLVLNDRLYRIAEGHVPPTSRFRRWRAAMRRAYERRDAELATLEERWGREGDAFPHAARYGVLKEQIVMEFPYGLPDQILPTRFGNAIRAFETYPANVYGADGPMVWPRLQAVIPKDYLASATEARSRVDCFMNLAYLAGAFGLYALLHAAWIAVAGHAPLLRARSLADLWSAVPAGLGWALLMTAAGAGGAAIAYRMAVLLIQPWGAMVKSMFDCYLPALARQLGYQLPEDERDRVLFWKEISAIFAWQAQTTPGKWRLAVPKDVETRAAEPAREPPTIEDPAAEPTPPEPPTLTAGVSGDASQARG